MYKYVASVVNVLVLIFSLTTQAVIPMTFPPCGEEQDLAAPSVAPLEAVGLEDLRFLEAFMEPNLEEQDRD